MKKLFLLLAFISCTQGALTMEKKKESCKPWYKNPLALIPATSILFAVSVRGIESSLQMSKKAFQSFRKRQMPTKVQTVHFTANLGLTLLALWGAKNGSVSLYEYFTTREK